MLSKKVVKRQRRNARSGKRRRFSGRDGRGKSRIPKLYKQYTQQRAWIAEYSNSALILKLVRVSRELAMSWTWIAAMQAQTVATGKRAG